MKKIFSQLDSWIAAITLAVMLTLAFANVVSRYILHTSISFTEEITTSLFLLLATVGTAIAAERRTHLGLGALTELLPKHVQQKLEGVANLIGLVFSLILLYWGCKMVENQLRLHQLSTTLMIPQAIYGSFLPIGTLVMAIRFGQVAWRCFTQKEVGTDGK